MGNVRATVSDRKLVAGIAKYTYVSHLTSKTDYYPFGWIMPGRQFSGVNYRYGFNGMEKDDEVKGTGNSYDFGARIYDPRIGRWMSVDPLSAKYPSLSPYNYAANSPIAFIDIDGREIGNPNDADVKKFKKALKSTKIGRQVWKAMVRSERLIYIYFGDEKMDGSDPFRENVEKRLKKYGEVAETLSQKQFDNLLSDKEETHDRAMEGLDFNKKTGEFDKNDNWNTTYILISGDNLRVQKLILLALKHSESYSEEFPLLVIGVEEGIHSLQDYGDFYPKQQDTTTGDYIEPDTEMGSEKTPYNERRHEKEAKREAKKAGEQYKNLYE